MGFEELEYEYSWAKKELEYLKLEIDELKELQNEKEKEIEECLQ